jgi:hypothetical protein
MNPKNHSAAEGLRKLNNFSDCVFHIGENVNI